MKKGFGGKPYKGQRQNQSNAQLILGRVFHEFCKDNDIDILKVNLTMFHFIKIIKIYGPTGKQLLTYVPDVLQKNWRKWYVDPHGQAGIR